MSEGAGVEHGERFRELDAAYDAAQAAWGAHVDTCPDCARSVFACQVGLDLGHRANAAWCEAKREWERINRGGASPGAESEGGG